MRAEISAALVAALGTLIWFLLRTSPGVAFGPWQGPLLSHDSLQTLPLLSSWLATASASLDLGSAAARLNALSALFGAAACGALAALVTRAAKATAGSVEAAATGLVAAGLLASSPAATYASTGGGPTTLSLALGLTSALLLVLGLRSNRRGVYLLLAAISAGLAAANHPTFGLLLFVLWMAHLLVPNRKNPVPGIAAITFAFAAAASLPVVKAVVHGESMQRFLSHALSTPYPTIGDGRPQLGFAHALLADLSLPALILALPALALFFRRPARANAVILGALLLMMGPFLPFLTNQYTTPVVLRDANAPRLMALAAASAFSALGILLLLRLMSATDWARPRRLAVMLAIAVTLFTLHERQAPDRRHDVAEALAEQILQGCPADVLLVTGTPEVTSLVTAYQASTGKRRDVVVLPTQALTHPHLRERFIRQADVRLNLSREFPPRDALERWELERPQVLREMLDNASDITTDNPYWLDLALWDIVRDNPALWPVCFVGIDATWLSARAQVSGAVMCYPRVEKPLESRTFSLARRVFDGEIYRKDPGMGQAFAQILLPLSAVLRSQGEGKDALRMAELVQEMEPNSTAMYALARATARQGDNESAAKYAEAYVTQAAPSQHEQDTLVAAVQSDLRSQALAEQFRKVVDLELNGTPAPQESLRDQVAAGMWAEDAVYPLASGYRAIAQHNPADLDALYQGALALTQVGDLQQAELLLAQAAELNPTVIATRLAEDKGKFALLQAYIAEHRTLR